jgi:ATP-dependent helicase/nuclease subunit B
MKNNLFSIPPHVPFLPALANGVIDGTLLGDWPRNGPFWLSDVTIILPTRRARLALSQAFSDALGGAALLPDIRTFGGEPAEEDLFVNPADAPPLPRAVSSVARRFILSALVEKWAGQNSSSALELVKIGTKDPSATFSLADSLARLIDDFETEQVPVAALRSIVPEELAGQWQQTLEFLEIALSAWPQILEQRGEVDATKLRNLRLQYQAKNLELLYGDRPVIAAGSTGSVPATAALMKAITGLARGALVLPGLDKGLSEQSLATLLNQQAAPHGHPQYGLAQLLEKLGRLPRDVVDKGKQNHRTRLIRQALALAEETANWNDLRQELGDDESGDSGLNKALEGISVIAAPGEQQQAAAIALAARDALTKNQSVGIISPDRNLARRIGAELKRYDIEIDDSAGVPLFQSRAGRLVRQILACCVNGIAPVDLVALLHNRYLTLGYSRAHIARLAQKIEFGLLRGQRPMPGFAGLRSVLEKNIAGDLAHVALSLNERDGAEITALLAALETALLALNELLEKKKFTSEQLADALLVCFDHIRLPEKGARVPSLPGAEEFTAWANSLVSPPSPGPDLNARVALPVLEKLMAGISVRTPRSGRSDIAIWGRLEARLQTADLMILAALNEGSWPEVADPGPWLSRGMRLGVGLEPPERQHGLAAHDFEMALGNKQVLLAYARRVGTSPAIQSRLLQRFLGFIGPGQSEKLVARGEKWLDLARRLDKCDNIEPAPRPAPAPIASLRPKSLSITEVETLFRSPYDIYAKYCLGLSQIDPLGEELGARERGTFIHAIFEKFVTGGHDPQRANAAQILEELAEQAFSVLNDMPERRDIWKRRFATAAEGFLAFERTRAESVTARYAEISLRWKFLVEGQQFSLRGRADRIDLLRDGSFEIIDFKTGGIPTKTEMKNFEAPQLLLEALMVREAGFEPAGRAKASALTYIKIGAGPKPFFLTPFELGDMDINQAADEVLMRLSRHVQAFLLSSEKTMPPRLLPKTSQRFRGAYEHLARTEEWTRVGAMEADI